MKKLLLLAALALPLAACATTAPTAGVSVDPARLSQHVRVLSSDAFEGRGPATAGEEKTVAYLAQQFQAVGVEPGGALVNGVRGWTQDVPLGRFDFETQPVSSVTVGGQTIPLRQSEDIAVRPAQTNVDAVVLKDAPLVFLGYGVKAPERGWDDFKGQDLKGKVGIVLINDPDFETGAGDFGGKAMTWYGRWVYKYEEAAEQGLAGLIIVHETAPASYGWPTVKNSNTNTQFDIVRANPAAAHTNVEAWIQRDIAVDILRRAGHDFEALKKSAQSRDFQPVPLNATFSTTFDVRHDVIVSKNVAARLTGATRPDEYVIHTAHHDHIGVGLPDAEGDTIYNGAVDNATGTAALIELARVYAAEPRTERSVVFLAVAAEEKGLLGSEYYAANPLYPLEKTVAVLNTDALSPWGPARDFTISGQAELGLKDMLIATAARNGRTFTPDPRLEAGSFYRSDHFPFAKMGVPAISFGAGRNWVEGGLDAGRAWSEHYTATMYHQQADEWSPQWTFTGLAADLNLLHELGRELANSAVWPEWGEGSEFKATRDASAAARR
ncbi:MAG TPA: M28 family metallopeptidase [Caulobacteraceae bacterium]|nr:M28 family metallopeptidase [Caulobacteraceae bacterium]